MKDLNNIGKMIKILRTEKGISQQKLADALYIGREAVSKWENGVTIPEIETIINICDYFDVTFNELLYGERETKENEKDINKISISLFEENLRKRKKLVISIILIVLLSLTFFAYYFFTNYNSIKVYMVGYESNDIKVTEGLLITTRNKIFLRVGNIETEEPIERVEVLLENKVIYFSNDIRSYLLYDYDGYEQYIDFKSIKNIKENLYLKLYFEDYEKEIKLDLTEKFKNDSIFKDNAKENGLGKEASVDISNLEEVIKSKFELIDNVYNYIYDDTKYSYFSDTKALYIYKKDDYNIENWKYNLKSKTIFYYLYDIDYSLIESYVYINDKITCDKEDCNEYEENKDNILTEIDDLLAD